MRIREKLICYVKLDHTYILLEEVRYLILDGSKHGLAIGSSVVKHIRHLWYYKTTADAKWLRAAFAPLHTAAKRLLRLINLL